MKEVIERALKAHQEATAATLAYVESLESKIHQLEHDLAGFEDWDAHMAQKKAMRELIRDKIVNGDIWLNDTDRSIFLGAGHINPKPLGPCPSDQYPE